MGKTRNYATGRNPVTGKEFCLVNFDWQKAVVEATYQTRAGAERAKKPGQHILEIRKLVERVDGWKFRRSWLNGRAELLSEELKKIRKEAQENTNVKEVEKLHKRISSTEYALSDVQHQIEMLINTSSLEQFLAKEEKEKEVNHG